MGLPVPGPNFFEPLRPTKLYCPTLDVSAFRPFMDAVAVARFPRHHIEERVPIVVRRYILISRREPTFVFAFVASLFAFAFDTPPFAFALLYPR